MASPSPAIARPGAYRALDLLWQDKFATAAALFLGLLVIVVIVGPPLSSDAATRPNLGLRNTPPFSFEHGFVYVFGGDALGRSILARLIVAGRVTLTIAGLAVLAALVVGTLIGLAAGFARGWISDVIMRLTDIVMGFPSLLLAIVILYMFDPGIFNLVLVLAITRLPVYIRTTRAEVLEVRERLFVSAATVMGASPLRIVLRHVLPMVVPTLLTIATVEFALVMLAESGLSFLGIGIQPPEVSWGLMVAQGRAYLGSAWWLAFFPGLAIMLTTLSLNLLSSWLRVAMDPTQRWRLEARPKVGQ